MEFISWIISLLLQWYVWVPIVLLLAFLTWRNYKNADLYQPIEGELLTIEIPKANDNKEQSAEQLFTSLHGILRDQKELKLSGGAQEHLSVEITSTAGQIRFYAWVPKSLQSFVESQVYAQYPTAQIYKAEEDYTSRAQDYSIAHTVELITSASEFLPIRTYQTLEVDPLTGIADTLAKLDPSGEELWVQILARPLHDEWHDYADRYISQLRKGTTSIVPGFGRGGGLQWLMGIFMALWQPPEQGDSKGRPATDLSEKDKTRVTEAEKKATKLGYDIKIRLVYLGGSQTSAKLRMQSLVGTFKQFNSSNLNGFKSTKVTSGKEQLDKYRERSFVGEGFILNTEELASIYHLPYAGVETPNIVWASSKTAEPPAKLPIISGDDTLDDQISPFGVTSFRGVSHQFGMLRSDRSKHVYIIGQTGTGKSGLLELFALSDTFHSHGYAIIDPHGDFAIDNMKFIPGNRLNDVIYFNPADTDYPLGFNPLEITDPSQKANISSEVIGVLKKMFENSWGPRLEHILRYTLLALLDRPSATMLDITRMLTDAGFREDTLGYCQDPVVLQFWNTEFASWNDRFASEAVAPVLNKVGAFTANPIIRNIIGQPKSSFNIREIMDQGKILIVNLSKGLIGEDNASTLGAFMVTKIQLAAMSRSDIPDISNRRPFYLYVDEFQNFATDSFATILSEARKYGLNLTVANQYISQMNNTVRDAVFGNVGTMISFRVSADDAQILSRQFEPNFEPQDLLQMHNRSFIINMVIDGEKVPAFSAKTLDLPPIQADNTSLIIEQSRRTYSRSREEVEIEVAKSTQITKQTIIKPATRRLDDPRSIPPTGIATSDIAKQPAEHTPLEPTPAPTPRKKRTRTRHKKPLETTQTTAHPAQPTNAKNKQIDNSLRIQRSSQRTAKTVPNPEKSIAPTNSTKISSSKNPEDTLLKIKH